MTQMGEISQGLLEPERVTLRVESNGMPQIHLETSPNLEENICIPDILAELVVCLSDFAVIDPAAVKAYHSLRTIWAMGVGAPEGFVQCQIAILTGRSDEVQGQIADAMMEVLKNAYRQSVEHHQASITVEIREMRRDTFRKVAAHPL